MRMNNRKRIGNRLELLEPRQMMAVGDVLVQLTRAGADFGADVELSGDILVVGAPGDDTAGSNVGRVYVYRLNGTPTPNLIRTIENPLPSALKFGRKLDVNGSQLIVSAQDTAFIFDLNAPLFEKTIHDPVDDNLDDFGADVAISDQYYVVTSPGTGFFGGGKDNVYAYNVQTDDRTLLSSLDQGSGLSSVSVDANRVAIGFAASVQVYNATTGNLLDSLAVPNQSFGTTSTAIQGTQIVAGGTTVGSPTLGGQPAGAAYLFDLGQTDPTHTWLNPNPVVEGGFGGSENFGASVAFDGRIAAAGEPQGESADAGQYDSPDISIFDTVTGKELVNVVAPAAPLANTSPTYNFGRSIAVSGPYVAVGANSTVFVLDSGLAALNQKPVVSGVPTQVTYKKNATAVRISPSATVTDTDSLNFAGGQITASITKNAEATDVIAIRNVGNAAGQIGISGSSVKLSGIVIGTFSGGTNGNPLVVSLNSKATPAAAQALLRNITYKSTSESPSTLGRPIKLTVGDGDGGTSAAKTVTVKVIAVNDAPVLNAALNPKLASIAEDNRSSPGTLVSSLLVGAVTDPDKGASRGIAVTAASRSNGDWQYSRDGGKNWVDFGTPSGTKALLIPAFARVRFVPKLDFNGQVKLYYKAWDQTEVSVGGTLNVSTHSGGNHSLSTASENATLTVTPVNDSPFLDTTANPELPTISENTISPAGVLIKTLIGASISDIDAGALEGIAITNADSTNGTWQFSLNGTSWKSLGIVLESQARLLPSTATARIRFIPKANFSGQASITYRAWDRTAGAAGQTLSTSGRTGGTQTFSSFYDLATITVLPGS